MHIFRNWRNKYKQVSRKERKLKKTKMKELFWDYFLENWVPQLDIKSPCKYTWVWSGSVMSQHMQAQILQPHQEILRLLLGKAAVLQHCVLLKRFQVMYRNPMQHHLAYIEVNPIWNGLRPEPTSRQRHACCDAVSVIPAKFTNTCCHASL